MSFDIDIGFASVAGKRPVNEDFALAWLPAGTERQERGLIAAVADGVSTGGGGREAAQSMVTGLFSDWRSAPVTWETSAALDRIITAHNAWLYAHNRRSDNGHERATTLTAVVARGQTWTVAHVGDSRAYLIRGADVEHLTTDHARPGDLRAALTRALGIDERVLVDYAQGELRIHDVLLLATDGAWSKLRDRDLAEAVGQCDSSQEAAERLTQLALARGSTDNVTVLVLRVRGLPTDDLGVEMLRARQLAVPRRLRPGEALDGLVVLSVLAQSDVTLLYQVEDQADGRQYVLKTLAPGRQNDDDERANLAHEAWLGQRFDSRRSCACARVRMHPACTCCSTGMAAARSNNAWSMVHRYRCQKPSTSRASCCERSGPCIAAASSIAISNPPTCMWVTMACCASSISALRSAATNPLRCSTCMPAPLPTSTRNSGTASAPTPHRTCSRAVSPCIGR